MQLLRLGVRNAFGRGHAHVCIMSVKAKERCCCPTHSWWIRASLSWCSCIVVLSWLGCASLGCKVCVQFAMRGFELSVWSSAPVTPKEISFARRMCLGSALKEASLSFFSCHIGVTLPSGSSVPRVTYIICCQLITRVGSLPLANNFVQNQSSSLDYVLHIVGIKSNLDHVPWQHGTWVKYHTYAEWVSCTYFNWGAGNIAFMNLLVQQ